LAGISSPGDPALLEMILVAGGWILIPQGLLYYFIGMPTLNRKTHSIMASGAIGMQN